MKTLIATLLLVGTFLASNQSSAQQISAVPATFNAGHGNSRYWVDVDNDGKDDYCALFGHRDHLVCWRSTGTEFQHLLTVNVGYPVGNKRGNDAKAQWSDVNGDGYTDFCRELSALGLAFVDGRFVCNLGPQFNAVNLNVAVSFHVAYYNFGASESGGASGEIFGRSGAILDTLKLHDLNEDGRQDLCYQYADYGAASGTEATRDATPQQRILCQINTVSGFAPQQTLIGNYIPDEADPKESKAGFYDFNGDGRADFCNRLGCYVREGDSFSKYVSFGSSGSNLGTSENYGGRGAMFVDFNGDGKVDFCSPTSWSRLVCLLSNGKDGKLTPTFSGNLDVGHTYWRWWVDVNADGYPDYCRAVGANIDYHEERLDRWGTLSCRLGSAGGFSIGDIAFDGFNFGMTDGGRAFCDPWGNGLQTFCRSTRRAETLPEVCSTNPESGSTSCSNPVAYVEGLRVGLSDATQADPALIAKYSDGLGAETRITYLPMTDDRVYKRSYPGSVSEPCMVGSSPDGGGGGGCGGSTELQLVMPRQHVVSETRAWLKEPGVPENRWKPLTGNANYFYKDLLTHRDDGSRGFRERFAFQEGNNTLEYTVYNQGPVAGTSRLERLSSLGDIGTTFASKRYAVRGAFLQSQTLAGGFQKTSPPNSPSTTREVMVGKVFSKVAYDASPPPTTYVPDHPFGLLQTSVNTLGRRTRSGLLPISYTRETTTAAWDLNGAAMPGGYSLTEIDDFGSITSLRQDTTAPNGRVWSKVTTNRYDADNVDKWLLGRLTNAKVVSNAPTPDQQLADLPRSAGTAPNSTAMAPPAPVPTAPQPVSPAVLAAILQLMLED
jgi:hypothetical protein